MMVTSVARIFGAIYERRWPLVSTSEFGIEIVRPINTFAGKLALFIHNNVDKICLLSSLLIIFVMDKDATKSAEELIPALFWCAVIWSLIYFMYFLSPIFLILSFIACLPCIILILQRFFNLNIFQQNESERAAPATQEALEKVWKATYISDESFKYVNPDKPEQTVTIQKEDTKCSICLGWYDNEDELRILPCSHHFHLGCADEWFKITATCPLCVRPIIQQQQPATATATATQSSDTPDSNV